MRFKRALRDGTLIRPSVCHDCGGACRPDAHHADYSRPLDVVWVCRKCHRRRDVALRVSRDPVLEPSAACVEQVARATNRPNQTVLRQHEICARLGICDETWRQWVRSGRAPAPLAGFPRLRPRWSVEAIEDFERGRGAVGPTTRRYLTRHLRKAV